MGPSSQEITTMTSLAELLADHHQHCDRLFSACEEAALADRWPAATAGFAAFRNALASHFADEALLFPAFEAATGTVDGPTRVMRFEHGQMREILDEMAAALASQQREGFAGLAEALLILMQQHNMKEENILYPMCDRILAAQAPDLVAGLAQALETPCPA